MTEAPTKAIAGVTPDWHRLRVVDAATGEEIDRVREADADAGTLVRSVDENGNLRIEDGKFVIVTEHRAIRIEWIDAAPLVPLSDAPERPAEAEA